MSCQVCHEKEKAPYKCPKCRIKYCSVVCYQKHKTSETCQEAAALPPPRTSSGQEAMSLSATAISAELNDEDAEEEESDRLAPEVLERIGHSKEIRELLKNRHLRAMMKMLSQSQMPADDMQKAMLEPIFVQFVDQLLLLVENKEA